jgi:hypothetical protein
VAFSTTANATYKIVAACSISVFMFALTGCGSSRIIPVATPITVTLNQSSLTALSEFQSQFTATVQGTSNVAIIWSVDGVVGGSSVAGKMNSSGLYTAPSQPGIHNVTATSVADTTKNATATVTVVDLELTPAVATVDPLTTPQFTATLQGSAGSTFIWSVDGIAGGGAVPAPFRRADYTPLL